jgi:Mg2+ and Co2+ transporter CorA
MIADFTVKSSDVLKYPRARLLRDIFLMQEELEEIVRWRQTQSTLFWNLSSLLAPYSYKTTTRTRCLHFESEYRFLCGQIDKARQCEDICNGIRERLVNSSVCAAQMLKISEENSGHAIMIFTVVATIFLPLSWATSYLGMNTTDIRSLEQGQWLFWTIAGPVATLVIGIALMIALKGEEIREYLIQRKRPQHPMEQTAEPLQGPVRTSTMMSAIMGPRRKETDHNVSWARLRRKKRVSTLEGDV